MGTKPADRLRKGRWPGARAASEPSFAGKAGRRCNSHKRLRQAKPSSRSNRPQAGTRGPCLYLPAPLKNLLHHQGKWAATARELLGKIMLNTSPQRLLLRATLERAVKETADTDFRLTGSFASARTAPAVTASYLRHPGAFSARRIHMLRSPREAWSYSSEGLSQF